MYDILLYGVSEDPHLINLKDEISKRGKKCVVLHSDTLKSNFTITADISNNSTQWILMLDCGRKIDHEELKLIWLRNKKKINNIQTEDDQAQFYYITERQKSLEGLSKSISAQTINEFGYTYTSSNKCTQLHAAVHSGFSIPSTLITNSFSNIKEFSNSNSKLIKKPLSVSAIHSHNPELQPIMMYTSKLNEHELNIENKDRYSVAPMIIQESIEKASELRIIQIGGASLGFSLRVNNDSGEPDWRIFHKTTPYEPIEVPASLSKCCENYLNYFNLNMGIFDIACTKDGTPYFLECNPTGQWAWLDLPHEHNPAASFIAEQFIAQFVH